MSANVSKHSLFPFSLPKLTGHRSDWGYLNLTEQAWCISQLLAQHHGLIVCLCQDSAQAQTLTEQLTIFCSPDQAIIHLPEWETLPYDRFSPHQDIIANRLSSLYQLPQLQQGCLVIPINSLVQRLAPTDYVQRQSLQLAVGDTLDISAFLSHLEQAGYQRVNQVMEPGELAVRGALIDLFPIGSQAPIRLDLFDNELETIRLFDPDTQISQSQIEQINLLPAKEYDFSEGGIRQFRLQAREIFGGDVRTSQLYKTVSDHQNPGGLEYYLPMFFEQTATLFDYLPNNSLFIEHAELEAALEHNWHDYLERYEIGRHDNQRPLLPPQSLLMENQACFAALKHYHRIRLHTNEQSRPVTQLNVQFDNLPLPNLQINHQVKQPLAPLQDWLSTLAKPVIICAESLGRREALFNLLRQHALDVEIIDQALPGHLSLVDLQPSHRLNLAVAPVLNSSHSKPVCLIAESALLGQRVEQKRRRKKSHQDFDQAIANLIELEINSPIVHYDHGVGRYQGLLTLEIQGENREFMVLEYANQDKLYVPVTSLHLVSRYTGTSAEHAPLHKLGTDKWDKAKRKAAEKARDVAAELLEIYAKRAAQQGMAFELSEQAYQQFCAAFPFEETDDQLETIAQVLADMQAPKPMDRLVCGDVGFGKTEVAMRAAFVAAYAGKQVAILVPTTLLAQQHFESFRDRFAEWPVNIAVLSRFQTAKEQTLTLEKLAEGGIDIIIGTHKLIQKDVKFNRLGLLIIDEEHRFGVRQKEQLKKWRTQVDILTMTATPIPRTLSMAMNALRDLSIIATPPAKRLSVQTFVQAWQAQTVREACLRELRRGGQIYFLFNEVDKIDRMADDLATLIPEAKVAVAHGQMNERQLEQVMQDFYHRRSQILVCTTIIETGIDVPNANTILIYRADKFGLAQLHQLRGRVGRSHHKAYAYMLTGEPNSLTDDARKRLDAIAKHDTLGAGFMLASHDLEIRGAGELLGEGQSGQIQEVGFGLYNELLERTVKALKSGKQPALSLELEAHCEVELGSAALIPDDYLADIHTRLVFYKRIASAETDAELHELEIEMIDRFGLLPDQVKNLFSATKIKLLAQPMGIIKIDASAQMIRIQFNAQPTIAADRLIQLIQTYPQRYQLKGQAELKIFDKMEDVNDRVKQLAFTLSHLQPH